MWLSFLLVAIILQLAHASASNFNNLHRATGIAPALQVRSALLSRVARIRKQDAIAARTNGASPVSSKALTQFLRTAALATREQQSMSIRGGSHVRMSDLSTGHDSEETSRIAKLVDDQNEKDDVTNEKQPGQDGVTIWRTAVMKNLRKMTKKDQRYRVPLLVFVKIFRLGWLAEAASNDPVSFYRSSFFSTVRETDMYVVLGDNEINGVVTGLAEVIFILSEFALVSLERDLGVREGLSRLHVELAQKYTGESTSMSTITINNSILENMSGDIDKDMEVVAVAGDKYRGPQEDRKIDLERLDKTVQGLGFSTLVLVRLAGNPLARLAYAYACLADPSSSPGLLQWCVLPFVLVQAVFAQNILPLFSLALSMIFQSVRGPDLVKKTIEETNVPGVMLPDEAVRAVEQFVAEQVIDPQIGEGKLDPLVHLEQSDTFANKLGWLALTHPEQLAPLFVGATLSIVVLFELPYLREELKTLRERGISIWSGP